MRCGTKIEAMQTVIAGERFGLFSDLSVPLTRSISGWPNHRLDAAETIRQLNRPSPAAEVR